MDLKYLSDDEQENEENETKHNEDYEDYENYEDYNYYTSVHDLNDEDFESLSAEEKKEILEYEELINQKILKSTSFETYNTIEKKKNPIPSIEYKTKKSLSLNDFNETMDKIIESTKPKKFISSRTQDRKKTSTEIKINEIKTNRKFNGRLVPYFKSEKYKN